MSQSVVNRPRRRGRVFPEYNWSPEKLARWQAEIESFGKRCKVVWLRVCPDLIKEHYNWFIMIEPESGDYFIDPLEREVATIGDQDIELQKNNLDFVDDVRLVNGAKFKKSFF